MENKNITLSSGELKEIFKKSIQPFTDIVSEMKAISEKSASETIGQDAKEKLLMENTDYRFSALLCAIKKQDEEMIRKIEMIEKALTEETYTGDGGYTVPFLTEQSMRELIPTVGQSYRYCQVMPLNTGNPVNIKIENAINTLEPKKVVCLSTVTNELLLDAKPAIGAYVTKKMAQVIGAAIDTKVFQNGNTTFTGLFFSGNNFGNIELTSGTNPNTLTYQDIVNCFTGVDMNYVSNGAWYMSRSVYALVLSLVLVRPTFENPLGSIFGYPVRIIEKAPDASTGGNKPIVLFGDLTNSVVGDLPGIRFDLFDSGTVGGTSLIENDLTGIRAVKHVGFTPGLTEAYSVIKTAKS